MSQRHDQSPATVLSTEADILISTAHMLGFVPDQDLVLIGTRGVSPQRMRVVSTLRADLPPNSHGEADPQMVADCVRFMTRERLDGLIVTVIGGQLDDTGTLPHLDLVTEVEEAFENVGVSTVMQLWTPELRGGSPWTHYPPDEQDGGVLPAMQTSPLHAAAVANGQVTFGSRAEVAALTAPHAGADGITRRRSLDDARCARAAGGPSVTARRDQDLRRLHAAAAQLADGRDLDTDELMALAAALRDHRVRDRALVWAAGYDLPEVGTTDPLAAEALWLRLTQATPAPEVAEPAALLAFAVLQRGGGALVDVALARARTADPGHRLTELLSAAFSRGWNHDDTAELLRGLASVTN